MHRLAVVLVFSFTIALPGCGGSGSGGGGNQAMGSIEPTRFVRGLDPGPEVSAVLTLEQNWTDSDSMRFYNAPQGSRLIPYKWFLHLEQAAGEELFTASENILELGYLPREPNAGNPDGLPIGFVKDAAYDDGTPGLGMTCAACHTAQINLTRDGVTTAYLIDGAPALGDLESLLLALEDALQATLASNAKFSRFADRVMPGSGDGARNALRQKLAEVAEERRRYNELNLSGTATAAYGHGRIDAFGGIMNQVSVEFLGNPANYSAPNGPVSYPFLWDTPHHDFVQWTGSSANVVIPEAARFVGTEEIGAILRNAAQVLGVFGALDASRELNQYGGYRSTVNTDSMIAIEASLRSLLSPEWPDEFGAVDQSKAEAGAKLFAQACQDCHQNHKFVRHDPGRSIEAQLHAVGTDPAAAANFALREAEAGVLAGRYEFLASIATGEPLDAREPLDKLLLHTAMRAAVGPDQLGSVNLGVFGNSLLSAANSQIFSVPQVGTQGTGFAYKARPLNGIWATAPYLHNGSVPNLWELLKSPNAADFAARRAAEFYVGDREYDPVHVGFRSDQGPYLLDTTLPGNLNSGHLYGTGLSDEQKWQLIEYIKTL